MRSKSGDSFRRIWPLVIEALESAAPMYDVVNDIISFGKAEKARALSVKLANVDDGMLVLDAGIGPGNMSRTILSMARPALIVGLDVSRELLKAARKKLLRLASGEFQPVLGTFEELPFRDGAFDRIFSAYSLRDARDIVGALEEFRRVCKVGGRLAIVDIGKPDDPIKGLVAYLYVRFLMPLMAKLAIMHKIRGNPWRMILPTFKRLPTNGGLLAEVRRRFGRAALRELLSGGIIVMLGEKLRRQEGFQEPGTPA